jgi:hypothetical protein
LKVYHLPVTLTAVQFAIGTLLVAFMWGLNLYKRPKLTSSQVSTYFSFMYCSVTVNICSVFNGCVFFLAFVCSF